MIIVSGLSGAGKSTALHTLEDEGLFCTDNLPPELLEEWARVALRNHEHAAVCVDVRSAESTRLLLDDLGRQMDAHPDWLLLFIEADAQSLLRRFSTVRRTHPFAPAVPVDEAIARERDALEPLRRRATQLLDSSGLNPYELADLVQQFWQRNHDGGSATPQLLTTLVSFSYQRGLPQEADMVVDVRFLPNPHYEEGMARLTGADREVAAFLRGQPQTAALLDRMMGWLTMIRPQMERERKRHFTLAVGCSGGRHRSVFVVEELAGWMAERPDAWLPCVVRHRELGRQRTLQAAG
ncbi:MAG: RNase adapter RapZ [Zetaproteobacteria bacterium]|nr:MAG: RNase adapter RapZ [Zetaproteobacteria bacterium]